MRLSPHLVLLVFLAICSAFAQNSPVGAPPDNSTVPIQPVEDKRIFGVLPNYRTAEESTPFHSITSAQKFHIAFEDSFDWPVIPTAAAFAGLYQIENQNPSFGQGLKGYAQRFATAYGDQTIGNFMTEAIMPTLTHEDPRYFRRGEGSFPSRAWYSVTRIIVSKNDAGRDAFNISEWGGNAAAVAISNAYYPDTRTASDNVERLLIACGTDAFSDFLKEFWPDVKRKLFKKK
jgi:hypothetical protein